MGDKDDSRALLYIGIGAVAAIGAGYLLWRYALDEKQRGKVKDAVGDVVERGRKAATEGAHRARELASTGAHKAREAADDVRGRLHLRD
jgi:hypothetical protein